MPRSSAPRPVTIGDGFRFGLGLMLAQLVLSVLVGAAWIAGLGTILFATAGVK